MPRKKPKCVSQTHPMVEGQIAWMRRRRSIQCDPILVDYRRKIVVIKGGDTATEIMVSFFRFQKGHKISMLLLPGMKSP